MNSAIETNRRVDSSTRALNNVRRIWQDFRSLPFPGVTPDSRISHGDLAALNTAAAGCISTYLANGGRLDPARLAVLRKCDDEIDRVVEIIDGEARDYFEQLQLLTKEILRLAK